jgi:hypothetical protein
MVWLNAAFLVTGAYPLGRAWQGNRQTTLRQAVLWSVGAWLSWVLVFLFAALGHGEESGFGRHLALALTGCATVAVLGARRPGVRAWNFVVCGLLAVLLLPAAEGLGTPRLDTPSITFLAGTLIVGLANYLPTRLGPAALLLGAGCGLELVLEVSPGWFADALWVEAVAGLCLGLAPWTALALVQHRRRSEDAFDALWLDFRNRFGVVWGQRLREQFNRAAVNAGWRVTLGWFGLHVEAGATPPDPAKALAKLRALLSRFGPEEEDDRSA